MYNLYTEIGPLISNVTSAKLLEIALKRSPALAQYTLDLQQKFGVGKIIYGIKNQDGVVKFEYYFYGIDRKCNSWNDRTQLFKTAQYNSELSLEKFLAFHREKYYPKILQSAENKIARDGLTVYSVDFVEETIMTGSLSKLNLYYTMISQKEIPFVLKEETRCQSDPTYSDS